VERNFAKVLVGGEPVAWLGANFWSRTGGPLMWRSYDPAVVREELAVLAAHGLTMTRSFFYWPDFMPTATTIDDTLCEHVADFLDAHREVGMTTIPTFIVGHMSGENWDPSLRGRPSSVFFARSWNSSSNAATTSIQPSAPTSTSATSWPGPRGPVRRPRQGCGAQV